MPTAGIPSEGFNTVGQIVDTNPVRLHSDQDGTSIGFISEVDILKALAAGKDLAALTAEQLVGHKPTAVQPATPIAEAITIVADKHLLTLPVEEDGTVTYSVTRHDLLEASVGLPWPLETSHRGVRRMRNRHGSNQTHLY